MSHKTRMRRPVCATLLFSYSLKLVIQGILDFTMDIKAQDKSTKQLNFYKIMSETQIGEIHTLLMTFQLKLEEIKSMAIEWKRLNRPEDKKRVNKGKRMRIEFIEINYMSHWDPRFVNI